MVAGDVCKLLGEISSKMCAAPKGFCDCGSHCSLHRRPGKASLFI